MNNSTFLDVQVFHFSKHSNRATTLDSDTISHPRYYSLKINFFQKMEDKSSSSRHVAVYQKLLMLYLHVISIAVGYQSELLIVLFLVHSSNLLPHLTGNKGPTNRFFHYHYFSFSSM